MTWGDPTVGREVDATVKGRRTALDANGIPAAA